MSGLVYIRLFWGLRFRFRDLFVSSFVRSLWRCERWVETVIRIASIIFLWKVRFGSFLCFVFSSRIR